MKVNEDKTPLADRASSPLDALVSEWQPIETAPINQSVLIYIPNAEHYGEGIYRGLQVESDWLPERPRHWMTNGLHIGRDCLSQLPDPPTE